VQIALSLILNKNGSLIGQTGQPVKVGNTEITNQKNCDFIIKVLLEYTKIFRNNVWGWGAVITNKKLWPLGLEISTQTVRDIIVEHTGV
jgi:hypothetical protein